MHGNLPEVVISESVSTANSVTAVTTKEYFSGKAFAHLSEDLLKFAEEINIDENNHWPPTFEDLNARKPPESIIYFLTGLLKQHRHVNPDLLPVVKTFGGTRTSTPKCFHYWQRLLRFFTKCC